MIENFNREKQQEQQQKNNNDKEAEKFLKCKVLTTKIHCMRNVKPKVLPGIIGATGTISNSFRKYKGNIPRKHVVKELHKTALLGTAHILQKIFISTFIPGNIHDKYFRYYP